MRIPRTNREESEIRLAFRNQANFDEPAAGRQFRVLIAELVEGAFDGVSGTIRPDWSKAK